LERDFFILRMKLFSLNAGTSRVFGLDLLRFFAIIFVVVGHSMILVPKDIKKHVVKEGENMTTISYQYYVDKNLISSSNTILKFDTKADTIKVSKEKPARVSKILKAGQTIDIPVDGKFRKYVNAILLDGVAIFFVLSGFLIGGILIKMLERNPPSIALLVNFWNRRWLRTLPMYLVILLILLAFAWFVNPKTFPEYFGRYFFFLQNFNNRPEHFFGESWSLCIEEWFYFFIPLMLFAGLVLFKTKVRTMFIWVISIVIIGVLVYRYYFFNQASIQSVFNTLKDGKPYLMLVTTRIDSIVYGVLAAFVAFYYPKIWQRCNSIFLVLLSLYVLYYLKMHYQKEYIIWSPSINSICVMVMLPFLANLKSMRFKIFKFITFISLISYSMYLVNLSLVIHILIKFGMHGLLNEKYIPSETWYIEYAVYWAYVIGLSFVFYRFIEIPFMKMRKHEK